MTKAEEVTLSTRKQDRFNVRSDMSDSDSGSAGSAAYAPKVRKGPDGQVAKLRNRFEPPMSRALVVVLSRRSARVASASQPQRAGKRCRSSAQPADSAAPAASSAADPSADSPADLSAVTLAGFLARIEALEQRSTDAQQLSCKLRMNWQRCALICCKLRLS